MSSRGRGDYALRGGPGGSRGGPSGRGGGPSRGGYSAEPPVVGGASPPDQTVTKLEDTLLAKNAKYNPKDSFPQRPYYGTRGDAVTLWANYFVLTPSPKLVLYSYSISVSPAATGKKLAQIVRLLLETPQLSALRSDIVTDAKGTLISRIRLDDLTVDVAYRTEGEDEPRPKAATYQIKLRFTQSLPIADLVQYLTSTNVSATYDAKLPTVQALNIFLNEHARSNPQIATLGSSKAFSLGSQATYISLGGSLTALRGFFASVRVATARILVNVNVSHAAFYQEGPLMQLVTGYSQRRSLYRLEKFIKRLRVRTTHLREKKNKQGEVIVRAKTIFALASPNDGNGLEHPPRVSKMGAGAKDVQFWLDEQPVKDSTPKKGKAGKSASKPTGGARYVSVYEFFASHHNIRIESPDAPVVNVGNRENPTYLPLEVCHVLPGQPASSKLDPEQTQQMIKFAVRKPAENIKTIVTEGVKTVGLTDKRLPDFGVKVNPSMITVPGRVLPDPKILYGQNKSARVAGGSWNMVPRDTPKGLRFSTASGFRVWNCLYILMPRLHPVPSPFPTSNHLNQTLAKFRNVLVDTGINTPPPSPAYRLDLNDTDDPRLDSYLAGLPTGSLLFVILPATPIPLYNRIKQLCDVKYGIHSICSVGSKLATERGQDQYFRNIALKFNLKLGGNNHLVDPARLGLVAEGKTMVVGIDVTHPSPGSTSLAPSVAAMVASVDDNLGQWPGVLGMQMTARQEMVSALGDMLKSRLKLWRGKAPAPGKMAVKAGLPENIIIYRDGVSEGQYQLVIDEELPQLRAACRDMYPAVDQKKGLPRLALIIVGKRHNTRFYPTKADDADRSNNTKAGTIVDRGITEARNWDFFLQAHAALQGTVRPAHYFVLLDEIFRPRYGAASAATGGGQLNVTDRLQDLTQSMCYAFGRATKAVSYCTPAYYADILCERARCYLSNVFETPDNSIGGSVAGKGFAPSSQDLVIHASLKNSMFYI